MDEAERAALRAVGKVLPGRLTRIAAPGAERGPEPQGAWAAADVTGWRYFGTETEALEYVSELHRSERWARIATGTLLALRLRA